MPSASPLLWAPPGPQPPQPPLEHPGVTPQERYKIDDDEDKIRERSHASEQRQIRKRNGKEKHITRGETEERGKKKGKKYKRAHLLSKYALFSYNYPKRSNHIPQLALRVGKGRSDCDPFMIDDY
ncbi:predicted protein [Histoplasma capsulatum var. duboisii H88]|uniref:Predicted protein n=1 Tax=Ajellomyces capsulatus (strain H88) TaxID=544711 RepID=F0UUN2_AJEC8|nr:predicted protein [Histoplasma capsulatum var. duboisii H88]